MHFSRITAITFAALLAAQTTASPEASSLLLPLRIPPILTSSFCEYRPLRFHAGIDFSTGGRNGLPIQAIADGYAWRVRVSPFGYGKVLYFRLNDGGVAVFAHLSRFSPRVEELLRRKQIGNEQYTADYFLEPGDAPATRGEVIAYSGDTGAGPSHLHFEMRTERNFAINPLLHGYSFADRMPPRVSAIAFVPLDAHARIDGKPESVRTALVFRGGVWTIARVPRLWGRIGIVVAASDRVQQSGRVVGVFGTALSIDGREVFRREYDNLEMDVQNHAQFDRAFAVNGVTRGRYYNLFKLPGNRLSFYGDVPPGAGTLACGTESVSDGAAILGQGNHTVAVEVLDAARNKTMVRFSCRVERNPQLGGFASGDSASGLTARSVVPGELPSPPRLQAQVRFGRDWVFVEVTASRALNSLPTVTLLRSSATVTRLDPAILRAGIAEPGTGYAGWPPDGFRGHWVNGPDGSYAVVEQVGDESLDVSWESIGNSTYRLTVPLGHVVGSVAALRIGAGGTTVDVPVEGTVVRPAGGAFSRPDLGVSVLFPPGAAGEPVLLRMTDTPAHVPPGRQLVALGRGFQFEPQEQPLAHEITVSVRIPEGQDTTGVALYGLSGGEPRFLSSQKEGSGRVVSARLRHFSACALYRDTVPPVIRVASPRPNSRSQSGLVTISGQVEDKGSGLDPGRDPCEVRVDGKWVPAAPDENGRFTYRPPTPFSPGRHRITFRARDLAGNGTEKYEDFTVGH